MPKVYSAFDTPKSEVCSSGSPDFPIFEFEGEDLVMTNKKRNVFEEIQSFKDEVLLDNIIKRCGLTGETLLAPKEAFGDARSIPSSLLEVKQNANKVQSFVDKLSEADLALLNDQGFDAFLESKIKQTLPRTEVKKEEVSTND